MKETVYDELTLEKRIKAQFGLDLDMKKTLLSHAPVGPSATATLFASAKNKLYLYVSAQSKLTLGDIKKIVANMGLKAQLYLPPKQHPHYFDDVGTAKFKEVFPGRKNINMADIRFYKTLAPYNPALVLIDKINNGDSVYCYDSDSNTKWRVVKTYIL